MVGSGGRDRFWLVRLQAMDLSGEQVHVEDISAWTDFKVHRTDIGLEDPDLGRIRQAVAQGRYRPDAGTCIVGEEQRAVIGVRIRGASVERETADRSARELAGFIRDHMRAVLIRVV